MSKIYGICYKTKVPEVYNKGTKYERSCDEFLFLQSYSEQGANERATELNAMLAKGGIYERLNLDEVDHFFVAESCEMW